MVSYLEAMTADPSDKAGVLAPPPLIALATLALGLFFDWLWPAPLLHDLLGFPARIALGGVPMAAGLVIAIIAERNFHRIGTNAFPWQPALRLATTGIYAHTRNPMYLGLGLFTAGLATALASAWTLGLLIPAALVLHYGVVLREERYLERKFGDDYRAFKAAVPRYGWRM
jgi:protein-S-isoprenylcysteine O-methyltransferase Ste14